MIFKNELELVSKMLNIKLPKQDISFSFLYKISNKKDIIKIGEEKFLVM